MDFSLFQNCADFCKPHNADTADSEGSELSADVPTNQLTRMFAQQNLHDIPGQKMNQLTAQERSEAFYDLHGVSAPTVEETPELVAEKLDEIDLEMFLVDEHSAYNLALEMNSEYVQGLRLRFLRAENFNAARAARRMALNFELRLEYFGRETLGRDVLLSDFSEFDRSIMETGVIQICTGRDRVGRAVEIQMMRKLGKEPPAATAARIFFFWMQYVGNQEMSQKKGAVLIEYMVGVKIEQLLNTEHRERNPMFLKVIESMPVRMNALHVCFDDPRIRSLFSLLTAVIEGKFLCRLQSHFGSDVECMYSLMTYGIAPGLLPVQSDGTIDTIGHATKLAQLAALETGTMSVEKPASAAGVIEADESQAFEPTEVDVLLGRGKHGKKWPGNLRLRKLVDSYNDAYTASDREGKIAISNNIYDEMINSGRLFLVPSKSGVSDGWKKMPKREVCIRIAHLFRNLRAAEKSVSGP